MIINIFYFNYFDKKTNKKESTSIKRECIGFTRNWKLLQSTCLENCTVISKIKQSWLPKKLKCPDKIWVG